jgi:hypothetical protein
MPRMGAGTRFGSRSALLAGRPRRSSRLAFNTLPERVHQIDDVAAGRLFGPLDLLAFLLLADEILERIFVLVLKFLRLEYSLFRLDDVDGKVEHRHALHIRWIIAASGSVFLARAAFEEAVKHWPDQKLTLRQGIMLISEHPSNR